VVTKLSSVGSMKRAITATVAAAVMSGLLVGCGGDPTGEAEQAAVTYFSAPSTGEWGAAAAASSGWAQSRAVFYQYAAPITGLPSGTLFNIDATRTVEANFDELTEVNGVLRASGTLSGSHELADVEFVKTDDGVKVADYQDKGFPLASFWSQGDSVDSGGGLVLTSLVGRMTRTGENTIAAYQWVSVIENENSWPVSVDAISFTPDAGGTTVTWVQGQPAQAQGSTIAAQEVVQPGRTASIWVRQDAAGTAQGGGSLSVTLSGANTSRELTVVLPTMTAPPGWQPPP
jgi:hypothetical protein